MSKRQREVKDLVKKAGAELLDCKVCGSGHYKTTLKSPDGRERMFIFPFSQGDWRANMNKAALIRRWLRETEGNGAAAA